jgi:TRAP-type transport system periplasmic protein
MRAVFVTCAALGILAAGMAGAQELPKTHVKAVGVSSQTPPSIYDEKPFWNETIPKASNGQVTAEYVPFDIMGLQGSEMIRLTKMGVMDFASTDISKMAGDDPLFEGCDLAGLTLDYKKAREACAAWKPVMAEVMEKKYNTKLMAIGGNTPQVFWCRVPISGITDLKGKKVRVFNKTITDFIQAVGGTTVTIAFAEVVPALQRGVADCAITGSLSGSTGAWGEVTSHIYPLVMGWSINYQSVNLDAWKKFDPKVRDFFTKQFDAFEDKMWETIRLTIEDADRCNFARGECKMGKPFKLTEVPVTEQDKVRHREIMENVVLPEWAKRAGKNYATKWNETVGKVVGLQIPLDKL